MSRIKGARTRWKITPAVVNCPSCRIDLVFHRIDDPDVVEYRAPCTGCGWRGPLRELRCGGCHRDWIFTWTSEGWRCNRCGHTQSSSPPLYLTNVLD